jgi:hypothetical protein
LRHVFPQSKASPPRDLSTVVRAPGDVNVGWLTIGL